jgi:uncharacterized protein (DUF779 family)
MFQLQNGQDGDGCCCGCNPDDDMWVGDTQLLVVWVGFDSSGCQ